jgi:hypothetical protein
MSAISVNVLLYVSASSGTMFFHLLIFCKHSIFYYPTAVYTFILLDRQQHENRVAVEAGRGEADENTPLLGDE